MITSDIPQIPDLRVTDPSFGAIGDGRTLCTAAIQKAIDSCHARGGGRVVVPPGRFRVGTLFLRDRVELHLERDSVLAGSGECTDFPLLHPTFRSLHDTNGFAAILYAESAKDIAITGSGAIDGSNKAWNPHPGLTGAADEDGRPRNIMMVSCSRVRIEGVTLLNPVMWNQHYLDCEDVLIEGMTVYSHGKANVDGIDIDGCRRFTLRNSSIDSDDDALTLKSTSPAPCEDITVTGCSFRSHCNAIKTGTESTGGFRNVEITDCVVGPSADRQPVFRESMRKGVDGITAITIGCVDGGVCENIRISDITVEGTQSAIFIRLGKRNRPYRKGAAVAADSIMRDIHLANITARGCGDLGCYVLGLPDNPIRNLTLSNIAIETMGEIAEDQLPPELLERPTAYPQPTSWGTSTAYGFFIRHAENVAIDGMRLTTRAPDARPPFYLVDVKGISMKGVFAARFGPNTPFVFRKDVTGDAIDEPSN